jgi:hypothetical protein
MQAIIPLCRQEEHGREAEEQEKTRTKDLDIILSLTAKRIPRHACGPTRGFVCLLRIAVLSSIDPL